jgi:N,N'-diacetyllegionaminate synthase
MEVKIIAEIAQGFEGKPEQAHLLVKAGIASGADAIKLQCVYADDICVPDYPHYVFFKQLEMPLEVWAHLSKIVHDAGKEFILNVGGDKSLQMALQIKADAVKFHSTSFFCDDLIVFAKENFKKVYMSMGGISVDEIQSFIKRHNIIPNGQFSFTYGFQASPTPLEKNNLNKLRVLMKVFEGFSFGFEDHTDANIEARFVVPLMSIPMGVSHIEKHLTLDTLLNLEDAESALSVSDFKKFVNSVRDIEKIFGNGDINLTDIEKDYRLRVLKVAVANKKLLKGHIIKEDDIALKRVASPLENGYLRKEQLIGKQILVDIEKFEQILTDYSQ